MFPHWLYCWSMWLVTLIVVCSYPMHSTPLGIVRQRTLSRSLNVCIYSCVGSRYSEYSLSFSQIHHACTCNTREASCCRTSTSHCSMASTHRLVVHCALRNAFTRVFKVFFSLLLCNLACSIPHVYLLLI
jgi:hypothetical protein